MERGRFVLTEADSRSECQSLSITPPGHRIEQSTEVTQTDLRRQMTVPGHTGHQARQTAACGRSRATEVSEKGRIQKWLGCGETRLRLKT